MSDVKEKSKWLDEKMSRKEQDDTKLNADGEKEVVGIKNVRYLASDDYKRYMKKFHGFDRKLLDEVKEAQDGFVEALGIVSFENMLDNEKITRNKFTAPTISGRVEVDHIRNRTYPIPKSTQKEGGPTEVVKTPLSVTFRNKSALKTEVLIDLEKKLLGQ